MDRLSKVLLIPTTFATLAGFGLGQMTNVLQPYWPDAPHWVFAFLFWSGAALVVIPFPTWAAWVGWKNRQNFSGRGRIIVGTTLLICGCIIAIIGLSMIASGDRLMMATKASLLSSSAVKPPATSAPSEAKPATPTKEAVGNYLPAIKIEGLSGLKFIDTEIHTPGTAIDMKDSKDISFDKTLINPPKGDGK